MAYEDAPLVQLSPADMATLHRLLTMRADSCAETEAIYRREAARIAAVAAPLGEHPERLAGRVRANAEQLRRADMLNIEIAELKRLAAYFAPL